MTGPGREERALSQLLKVARSKVEDLQSHLANLDAAMKSAESSLDWLAQAVRAEELSKTRAAGGAAEFARFLVGAEEKREALLSTRDTLAGEAEALRETLGEALIELHHLENLIEAKRRAARARGRSAEDARPAPQRQRRPA